MSKFKGTLFYAPTNINHANASANSCRSSSKQAKDQIQILWAMIKLQSKLKAVSLKVSAEHLRSSKQLISQLQNKSHSNKQISEFPVSYIIVLTAFTFVKSRVRTSRVRYFVVKITPIRFYSTATNFPCVEELLAKHNVRIWILHLSHTAFIRKLSLVLKYHLRIRLKGCAKAKLKNVFCCFD